MRGQGQFPALRPLLATGHPFGLEDEVGEGVLGRQDDGMTASASTAPFGPEKSSSAIRAL